MNVVIYCRYSSHNQQETSIEGQLKVCLEFCQRNGYAVIGEYVDRAISGTTDNRPEFLRMIEDSHKRHFQYVIVYQLDRFSRNRYDSAMYKAKLKKNGIRVLSARENISDDASGILMESVLEGMAEYYSAELGQKIRRGMDLNAEKCLCTGGNIALGFRVGKDKRFEIDPNTAPLVKQIFEMYAAGKTVAEITAHLNALGHATSRGVSYNKNSLRKMLQNKRYIGIYTYKGKEIPGGMPRIISDELFYRVAEIMEKNKKAPAAAKADNEYILTTKLFCGLCNEMMTGVKGNSQTGRAYYYYKCNNAKKKQCHKKTVQKEYIEGLVINQCRELLTTENIKKIADEVVALCEKEKDKSNLKRLEKLIKENEKQTANLFDSLKICDIESVKKGIFEEMSKMNEARKELERELALEQASKVSISHSEIRFFLTQLKKGDINDIKYRKTLIAVLVNRIYLYDDKITMIFNSGDTPVTINGEVLGKIDEYNKFAFKTPCSTTSEQTLLRSQSPFRFAIGGFFTPLRCSSSSVKRHACIR